MKQLPTKITYFLKKKIFVVLVNESFKRGSYLWENQNSINELNLITKTSSFTLLYTKRISHQIIAM